MIREEEEEEEKAKEAGREWLEIREMKARHLTICLSANWSTTSISNQKTKKKRKKRRSATDINKYAFQDLIGLKQTSKQAV